MYFFLTYSTTNKHSGQLVAGPNALGPTQQPPCLGPHSTWLDTIYDTTQYDLSCRVGMRQNIVLHCSTKVSRAECQCTSCTFGWLQLYCAIIIQKHVL